MNHDNLNKVIDWLNKGAPETVFSMNYGLLAFDDPSFILEDGYELPYCESKKIDEGCGSVCCIAGAAAQFGGMKPEDPTYREWTDIQDAALRFFGVHKPENCPWMLPVFDPSYAPESCTPKQAAEALKMWAESGDINYNPWEYIE